MEHRRTQCAHRAHDRASAWGEDGARSYGTLEILPMNARGMRNSETTPSEQEISQEQQQRWEQRGRANVERLDVPEPLREAIRATLDTPQWGPDHNEGLRMASHLGCIDNAAEEIVAGTFHYESIGLPPEQTVAVHELLERTIRAHRTETEEYINLHDLRKLDCMNAELADGSQRVFTMEEWRAITADASGDDERVRTRLRELGIAKIGYRQSKDITGGEERDHGPEAIRYLEDLSRAHWDVAVYCAERKLILTGVANHEMHFQVFPASAAAKHYSEKIAKRFSEEEAEFILTVCFLDIAGSKSSDGASDYSGFRNMLEARESFRAIETFRTARESSGRPLRENELGQLMNLGSVDAVRKKIATLEKPPESTALTTEQLAAVDARLNDWMRDLKIPAEQEPAIRAALRSDHYARALGDLRLGKLTGAIKKLLTSIPS